MEPDLLVRLRTEMGIQVDFSQVLLAFGLLLCRVLPPIILTPFLGGESVPAEVKMGLGITLGVVLFPAITAQASQVPVSAVIFIALMLKELFLGLTLSFVIGFTFQAAEIAGNFIDTFSGTNMAQMMVPQIQQQTSLFSALQLQMTTVVFLTLGGHHIIIEAFADSLVSIPLDRFPTFGGGATYWPFFDAIIKLLSLLMRVSLALAAPVLLATFITDLGLGLINRVAPQVQVYFVSFQLKPAITVLIMVTAIHLVLDRVVREFGTMFLWLKHIMRLLA